LKLRGEAERTTDAEALLAIYTSPGQKLRVLKGLEVERQQ
jgi:hypothetical protein